jgi:hypothetical protein
MSRSAPVRDFALPQRVAIVASSAEIERHLERAKVASGFHRVGRHAAAERLLRGIAASLTRRAAFVAAAMTLVSLGRILLERGRATAAEATFAEAARQTELRDCEGAVEGATCLADARLWQATARTDAYRLTEAESLCHTVLRGPSLDPGRQAWAEARFARVLLWQNRNTEAAAVVLPQCPREGIDLDPTLRAVVEGTAVRVALLVGDVFLAGQRAQGLVAATAKTGDAISRMVALTAHLRVLAAVGDLDGMHHRLREIVDRARQAHTPLRAARARLIWHDALCRAGRMCEARYELKRLERLARIGAPLLRKTVENRIARRGMHGIGPSGRTVYPACAPPKQTSATAAAVVRLVQEEDCDRLALLGLIDCVRRELCLSRLDLMAGNARGAAPVMTSGGGGDVPCAVETRRRLG